MALNQEKASLQLEVCPKKDEVALLVVISLGYATAQTLTANETKT